VLDSLITLVRTKSRALLHDPPNKMWVLREHEEVAENLRELILGDTPLAHYVSEEHENIVRRADRMASTFDRWLINAIYASGGGSVIVKYNRLHNILRPDKFVELGPVTLDKALEIMGGVGSILREISSSLKSGESEPTTEYRNAVLLYSTLYLLLEAIWYSNKLPPSLADTRAPTHTIFDHLYATASMVNLNLYDIPEGFIVRIDIPGISNFISSSRKTTDFWAGSWILSKLMWGIIEDFIEAYGPDIVLSPTLRLNPYFFKYVVEKLERIGIGDSTISKVCEYYVETLSGLGWGNILREKLEVQEVREACTREKLGELLEMLTLTPLIPATAYLVLPPYIFKEGTEAKHSIPSMISEIRDVVHQAYLNSWSKLLNDVKHRLIEKAKPSQKMRKPLTKQILLKLLELEEIKKVIELPHVGLRIDVVDVRDTYEKLLNCLMKCGEEYCSEVGLNNEDVKNLEDIIRSANLNLKTEDLARNLLWHVITTRVLAGEATKSPIPLPRPFWVYENEEIKPVGDYVALTKAKNGDWNTCSLCGEEPAVIHPVKVWDEVRGVEKFEDEWMKKLENLLKDVVGAATEDELKENLKEIFRPGEALGPYCLLKRAVGEAYSDSLRKYYGLASTDDVALKALVNVLTKDMEETEKLREELEREALNQWKCNPLIHVIPEIYENEIERRLGIRNIGKAVEMCGLSFEEFKEGMLRLFQNKFCSDVRVCSSIVRNLFPELSDQTNYFIEVTSRPRDIKNFLKIRTKYAIIKGDGDYVGKLHQGIIEPIGLTTKDYVRALLEAISAGLKESEKEEIAKAYDAAALLSSTLTSGKGILVSPTLTATISLALQVTALKDVATIMSNMGLPIYTGGDDVLALSPIERWYNVVELLRTHFWGYKEGMFHETRVNEGRVMIAQALPTGRSFSVRIADLLDIMSREIAETLRLLEVEAKRAKWCLTHAVHKDSLIVSDSRSRAKVILPLSVSKNGERFLIAGNMLKTLNTIFLAENLGVVSSSLPEDLDRMLSDPTTGEKVRAGNDFLYRVFRRVLQRNINVKHEKTSEAEKVIDKLIEHVGEEAILKIRNDITGERLLEELTDFVRVSRGWL